MLNGRFFWKAKANTSAENPDLHTIHPCAIGSHLKTGAKNPSEAALIHLEPQGGKGNTEYSSLRQTSITEKHRIPEFQLH